MCLLKIILKNYKHLIQVILEATKKNLEDDGTQNYLVFQPLYKCFEIINITKTINGNLKNCLIDLLNLLHLYCYSGNKIRIKYNGSFLKQDKITFTLGTIVNIYIVYELILSNPNSSNPTLENCFSAAVKLTKNPDIDKYKSSGYGIGFDRK